MEMIVFIGLQGSGKSSFYQQMFSGSHVRLNLDMLKTRRREQALFETCLEVGQRFVVDNTNPGPEDRLRYLLPATAARFRCLAYYFNVPLETCLERNAGRTGKSRIPDKGILATARKLMAPRLDEGFSEIYVVDADGHAVKQGQTNAI